MTKILVAGKYQEGVAAVLRSLAKLPDVQAASAISISTVHELIRKDRWDLLLVCGGFSLEEETALFDLDHTLASALKVIPYFGGGSGLLLSEIRQALGS